MTTANEQADSRWWQNRANRAEERIENLMSEVAYQTALVDRVREYAVRCRASDNSAYAKAGRDIIGILERNYTP